MKFKHVIVNELWIIHGLHFTHWLLLQYVSHDTSLTVSNHNIPWLYLLCNSYRDVMCKLTKKKTSSKHVVLLGETSVWSRLTDPTWYALVVCKSGCLFSFEANIPLKACFDTSGPKWPHSQPNWDSLRLLCYKKKEYTGHVCVCVNCYLLNNEVRRQNLAVDTLVLISLKEKTIFSYYTWYGIEPVTPHILCG